MITDRRGFMVAVAAAALAPKALVTPTPPLPVASITFMPNYHVLRTQMRLDFYDVAALSREMREIYPRKGR